MHASARLPAATVSEPFGEGRRSAKSLPPRSSIPQWIRRPRILLADADACSRAVFHAHLEHTGAELVEAMDGISVQSLIDRSSWDAVVARTQLPRRSGLQVLAAARARGEMVPFVLVHSLHQPLMRVFVNEVGGGSVLATRTLNAQNLRQLLIRLMARSCPLVASCPPARL